MKNKLISYNPKLKELARKLRQQGILSEVLLWKQIKNKSLGVEFHRQVPIDEYIVDFFCHEIMLAIEIDGNSHLFEDIAVNDVKRQKKLEQLGVHFIRFNDKDVRHQMSMILIALENKIEQLKTSPLPPLLPIAIGRKEELTASLFYKY